MVNLQPSINMGIVGHVDHGKTTLTKLLSGKWTDTHSEEKKRGITIKLGYSNFDIFFDEEQKKYVNKNNKKKDLKLVKKISIVDAPGHETLMATLISGASVMDCAVLLISADEKCPQPQTREHLKTLEISDIKNIIVIQNKIDLVTREEAIENFNDIKEFLKGTIAQDSPIIPMSAEYGSNFDVLLEKIVDNFSLEGQDKDSKGDDSLMYIVRSFDINRPGIFVENMNGGILGGSIKRGVFKPGEEIEIKPGLVGKDNKCTTLNTKISSVFSDSNELDQAIAGGSIALKTDLDPYFTKSDMLVGQIVGKKGALPEPVTQITFENNLFKEVIGFDEVVEVKPMIQREVLMLIVNSMKTVGVVTKTNSKTTTVALKKPVMAFDNDKVVVFRRFEGNKWHIVGYGVINK